MSSRSRKAWRKVGVSCFGSLNKLSERPKVCCTKIYFSVLMLLAFTKPSAGKPKASGMIMSTVIASTSWPSRVTDPEVTVYFGWPAIE